MNKKGITTIELITSFALSSVIFIILFNLILSLKELYLENSIKTTAIINQSNLSRSMNKAFSQDKIVTSITNNTTDDNHIDYDIIINGETKKLIIDKENNYVQFDNYTYEVNNMDVLDLEITDNIIGPYIYTVNTSLPAIYTGFDSLLVIDIPIQIKSLEGNYGVKVVYQFNSNTLSINSTTP